MEYLYSIALDIAFDSQVGYPYPVGIIPLVKYDWMSHPTFAFVFPYWIWGIGYLCLYIYICISISIFTFLYTYTCIFPTSYSLLLIAYCRKVEILGNLPAHIRNLIVHQAYGRWMDLWPRHVWTTAMPKKGSIARLREGINSKGNRHPKSKQILLEQQKWQ